MVKVQLLLEGLILVLVAPYTYVGALLVVSCQLTLRLFLWFHANTGSGYDHMHKEAWPC